MARSVTSKYGFWLAGYYDDFSGARAIPDDKNEPSLTASYDRKKTHHGNAMNGEATLNPRYRWAYNEREQDSGYGSVITGSTNKFLLNNGSYEWLTLDLTRQKPEKWEGRAQLQYPDGIANANRVKFDRTSWSGSQGGYQRFCNGFNTAGSYVVPTGDDDSTFGRRLIYTHSANNYDGKKGGLLSNSSTNAVSYVQWANLAGAWMGEQVAYSHNDNNSGTTECPYAVFTPIKSPAGKPFLCVKSWHNIHTSHKVGSTKRPAIAYNGTLNSKDTGDVFTMRFAVRSFGGNTAGHAALNGRVPPTVTIFAGFPDGVNATDETGFVDNTNNAAIEWSIDFLTTVGLAAPYDYYDMLYNNNNTKLTFNNDDLWIDLDFVIDYDTNKYKVYHDGTEITATNGSGGSYSSGYTLKTNNVTSAAFNPSEMFGWQITVEPQATTTIDATTVTHLGTSISLLMDRVGLIRPLTDHPDGRELPPVTDMKSISPVNGISNLQIDVADDPSMNTTSGAVGTLDSYYSHQLTKLFNTNKVDDWYLLMFASDEGYHTKEAGAGRIDRPVWRGVVEKMEIKQNKPKTRTIKLSARDQLSTLDRQVPLWELGQGSMNTEESATPYWVHDSQGYNSMMYLGVVALQTFKSTVGFDKDDSYAERTDQRTQLYSAHPIQMYNNEDSLHGPNNIEEQYEGYAVAGVGKHQTSGNTELFLYGNPGYTTGSSVTVTNTSAHNVSGATPSAVATYLYPNDIVNEATYQVVTIASGTLAFVRETPLIIHAGNQIGGWAAAGGTSNTIVFHFDSDPSLAVGDTFLLPNATTLGNSRLPALLGIHKVKSIGNYIRTSGGTRYYRVVTHTPYPGSGAGVYGTDLSGNARIQWTKQTGTINPIVTDIGSRAIHSVWMRDLPLSLWFRYHFGIIDRAVDATGAISGATTTASTKVQITSATYAAIGGASGLAEIIDADGTVDTFIWKQKATGGGNYYLVGCEYLSRAHDSGVTINILDTSSNYKHCWLLWGDMRNNAKADADGSTRKNQFGLIYPTPENYDISLYYNDQLTDDGTPDKFTDLKLGQDVDLWEVSASGDPTTNIPFSKPADYGNSQTLTHITDNGSGKARLTVLSGHGVVANDYVHVVNSALHEGGHLVGSVGTNNIDLTTAFAGTDTAPAETYKWYKTTGSDKDLAVYQDWEDKGGAFTIIDGSKFFNLNTVVNGGKSGQNAGGNTDLGDYVATVHGFPALIDNYWGEAMSNFKTTAAPFLQHPNQFRCLSDGTAVNTTIAIGETTIQIDSGINFPMSGMGKIYTVVSASGSSTQQQNDTFYVAWDSRFETTLTDAATGGSTTTLVDSGATFTTAGTYGVSAGMLLKNDTTGEEGLIQSITNATTLAVLAADFPSGFGAGNAYTVPSQLANCFGIALSAHTYLTNITPAQLETFLATSIANANTTGTLDIQFNALLATTTGTAGQYDEINIFNSISSQFMLRLMMELKGYVRSVNKGSYWDSDKMRLLWSAGLLDSWFPSPSLPCVFDINNVPITSMMTTDGGTSNNDGYGSIVDGRSKTLLSIVKNMKDKNAAGYYSSLITTFSWLMGRDGKIEYRPKYNSGWSFDRTNLLVSDFATDVAGQISHVRIYYRNGKGFVDYPTPTLSDTTKWKVLEYPDLQSQWEAEAIAKQEYNRLKESRLSIKAEPMRDVNTVDKMLYKGRFGYVADPQRALQGYQNGSANEGRYWARAGDGGIPFTGMANAMDGNLKESADLYNRHGYGGRIDTTDTLNDTTTWNDNYYFYGANSVSYAVQIVNVAHGIPTTSDTTSEDLRIWVALKDGQSGTDIDNAEFTIGISDCSYSTSTAANGGDCPTLIGALATNGYTSVNVKDSGFYDITIPASYHTSSPQKKIVVSFNAEYCRALLRHRCGDPTGAGILHNAHNITVATGGSWAATSASSLFPLGARQYPEMGDMAEARYLWYAPRIHIVADLNYIPGTFVTYTDQSHDLSSEALVIQKTEWQVKGRNIEKVTLHLERDESRYAGGIVPYLFPTLGDTGRHNPSGGGGGGGGSPTPPDGHGGGGGREDGPDDGSHPPGGRPQGPNDQPGLPSLPGGGYNPGGGVAGNPLIPGYDGSLFSSGQGANNTTSSFHSNLKERMGLHNDQFSNQGQWAILGQKKPTKAPSAMIPVDGIDAEIKPTEGMAARTNEGFVLPGKGHPETSGFIKHSIETTISIPVGVVGEQMSVTGTVSCGKDATAHKLAYLYITVECPETSQSISHTVGIESGADKSVRELMPTRLISGLDTANNHVKVTITRKPGASTTVAGGSVTDNADNFALVLHNLKVNFNRASVISKSQGNEFQTHGDLTKK
tara:strand:- start:9349 stop:16338 length:6990 start_codon:yes stop_codon:yes gene_type:complete